MTSSAKAGVLPIPRPAPREKAARKGLRAVSEKRAASGEPVGLKRTELAKVSDRRREERPKASTTLDRSKPLGHASEEQKAKVAREGSRIDDTILLPPQLRERILAILDAGGSLGPIDPAHTVPRTQGGCDHEDCVVPLPRVLHDIYDAGELDLLPWLTLQEQAHAASHLGLLGALKRTTGEAYVPEAR